MQAKTAAVLMFMGLQVFTGWPMAKVEVVSGNGVLASASVIDSRTNDPTTIPVVREDDTAPPFTFTH